MSVIYICDICKNQKEVNELYHPSDNLYFRSGDIVFKVLLEGMHPEVCKECLKKAVPLAKELKVEAIKKPPC